MPSSRERTIGLLAPVGGVDIVAAELCDAEKGIAGARTKLIDSTTAARM